MCGSSHTRTNLRLYDLQVTPKLIKKVKTNLDLPKVPGYHCIPVVIPKKNEPEISYTVNDSLSPLGTYSELKPFGWVLIWTGCLTGPGCWIKKWTNRVTKSLLKLVTKIVLSLLFKLVYSFNWTWMHIWTKALIRNFSPKTGHLFGIDTW